MKWRYVNQLPIQERTKEVVRLAIEATRQQLKHERKKLQKLRYGS